MKKILTLLAIALVGLASCKKEPTKVYSISIDPTELSFAAAGGEETVEVTSSAEWELSGESYWCYASSYSGKGNAEILFSADPNEDSESSRSATFTFISGDKKATLTVTQEKKEYSISIEPTELTFGADGGDQTITVTSSDSWEVKGESDWCDISATTGKNGDKVTFSAAQYTNTEEARTATYTFVCGDKEAELKIEQEAKVYSISVEPTELEFEAEGGEYEVIVTSSDTWNVSTDDSWIRFSSRGGENGDAILISTKFINTNEERAGVVTFTCGNKTADIIVKQHADDSPIIQFNDLYFLDCLLSIHTVTWNDEDYYINIDKTNDGQISEKEAASIEVLSISSDNTIRNVDEIKYFTSLKYLSVTGNIADNLTIDLSNSSLHEFYSSTKWDCVDLSNSKSIKKIECGNINFLNVQNCISLQTLNIYEIGKLDASGCSSLTLIARFGLPWSVIGDINELTLRGCTALERLECAELKLLTGINDCMNLEYLYLSNPNLENLDLSNLNSLETVTLYGGSSDERLTGTVDVSGCSALTYLDCHGNEISSLNIQGCSKLEKLLCHYNQIQTLDLSDCTALNYLDCDENQITVLDLSNNIELTTLYCRDNQLTSLDLSNNTSLIELTCYGNLIASLDLGLHKRLEVFKPVSYFYDSSNRFTVREESKCPLTSLTLNKYNSLEPDVFRALDEVYTDLEITYVE